MITIVDQSEHIQSDLNTWSWDFGHGQYSSSQNPSHSYWEGGSYKVTLSVTNVADYMAVFSESIQIISEPHASNVFTPNQNGINDHWQIKYLEEDHPEGMLRLYNQWGTKIFQSKNYPQPWNGTWTNQDLHLGTYFYIINE